MRKINRNRKIKEIEFFERQVTPAPVYISLRNLPFFDFFVKMFFKIFLLEKTGYENALNVKLKEDILYFNRIPENFSGYRLLFISDLHLDGVLPLSDKAIELIKKAEYDLAILGGDYRYLHQGNSKGAEIAVRKIVKCLKQKTEVIGILGNHDVYMNGEELEDLGVKILVNDSCEIKNNGQSIFIAGVDDSSLFLADDVDTADKDIPGNSFKIMISHSPQIFKEVSKYGYDLMISGHTHGGQVCLPGGFAILKGAPVPRRFVKGRWVHENMQGITSTGAGVSVFPVRFNCLPEINVIELRRKE